MQPRLHRVVVAVELGHAARHAGRLKADDRRAAALLRYELIQLARRQPHAARPEWPPTRRASAHSGRVSSSIQLRYDGAPATIGVAMISGSS